MSIKVKSAAVALLLLGSCNSNVQPDETTGAQVLPDTTKPAIQPKTPIAAMPDTIRTTIGKKEILYDRSEQNNYLKQMETKPQYFAVLPENQATIKGAQGTIVNVVPGDLEREDGQPIVNDIHVELKELGSTEDFAQNNAPTVSDGRLLVSAGAYYVSMTSAGQQLKLRAGKTLQIKVPKQMDKEMGLFYGVPGTNGTINWKPARQGEVIKQVTESSLTRADTGYYTYVGDTVANLPQSGKIRAEKFRRMVSLTDTGSGIDRGQLCQCGILSAPSVVYEEINMQRLGWVNCDRFWNQPVTDFVYKINEADDIVVGTAFLIFRDINSVMQQPYMPHDGTASFTGVPQNTRATLVVISVKKGKVFAAAADITTGEYNHIVVSMKPMTDDAIRALFKASS